MALGAAILYEPLTLRIGAGSSIVIAGVVLVVGLLYRISEGIDWRE